MGNTDEDGLMYGSGDSDARGETAGVGIVSAGNAICSRRHSMNTIIPNMPIPINSMLRIYVCIENV